MTEQQKRKQHIRAFMKAHYTDERLAQLLAHAQDGKLAFNSCCCLIGAINSPHALRGDRTTNSYKEVPGEVNHHIRVRQEVGKLAVQAEQAFCEMCAGPGRDCYSGDAKRRRILIPMIRAEMRRRERARAAQPEVSTTDPRVAEHA